MKKILTLTALGLCLSGPVVLTSCNDDDVQTVIDIVSKLIQSGDELSNTAWLSADSLHGIEFGSNGQGVMADGDTGTVIQQQFTYAVGQDGSSLTFQFSDGTVTTYTITEYTAKKSMTLLNTTTGVRVSYVYTT